MKDGPTQLEHLISRFLDDECSSDDRRALNRLTRRDADAAALLDEQIGLDREFNRAMRAALGRPIVRRRRLPLWVKLSRAGMFAAAACLALLAWVAPHQGGGAARQNASSAAGGSWFSTAAPAVDCIAPTASGYELPAVQLRERNSQWYMVPGDQAGEVLIVEVRRVQSQTLPVRQDF